MFRCYFGLPLKVMYERDPILGGEAVGRRIWRIGGGKGGDGIGEVVRVGSILHVSLSKEICGSV